MNTEENVGNQCFSLLRKYIILSPINILLILNCHGSLLVANEETFYCWYFQFWNDSRSFILARLQPKFELVKI